MKVKTKYAAGMRDELVRLLGCPVEAAMTGELGWQKGAIL